MLVNACKQGHEAVARSQEPQHCLQPRTFSDVQPAGKLLRQLWHALAPRHQALHSIPHVGEEACKLCRFSSAYQGRRMQGVVREHFAKLPCSGTHSAWLGGVTAAVAFVS